MIKIKDAGGNLRIDDWNVWRSISTAPFDRDLELAVINHGGVHALVFPCRRILGGWIKQRIDIRPTHWREWLEQP